MARRMSAEEALATVTRERVIDAFKALPPGVAISTLGLAWLLGCLDEHRIRAAATIGKRR